MVTTKEEKKNKYLVELVMVRGWMLDIIYNSCGKNIKEVFGKKVASELKAIERREQDLIVKSNMKK